MGWFKKKDRILDLTENYKKQQEKADRMKADSEESSVESPSQSAFSFLGNLASGVGSDSTRPESTELINVSSGAEERKRKLAKRLMDITEKLEDLSNQIYHLQQRIELLERKSGVSGF